MRERGPDGRVGPVCGWISVHCSCNHADADRRCPWIALSAWQDLCRGRGRCRLLSARNSRAAHVRQLALFRVPCLSSRILLRSLWRVECDGRVHGRLCVHERVKLIRAAAWRDWIRVSSGHLLLARCTGTTALPLGLIQCRRGALGVLTVPVWRPVHGLWLAKLFRLPTRVLLSVGVCVSDLVPNRHVLRAVQSRQCLAVHCVLARPVLRESGSHGADRALHSGLLLQCRCDFQDLKKLDPDFIHSGFLTFLTECIK